MAGFYGNPVARYVSSGSVACPNQAVWVAIQAGSAPLANRQWIMFQVKSTGSLAIRFINKSATGTFTAPTSSAHGDIIYPARSVIVLPISDDVTIYGRLVNKAGSAAGAALVVVSEFA